MNIFDTIPKRTLILIGILTLIFLLLAITLLFAQPSRQPQQGEDPAPTSSAEFVPPTTSSQTPLFKNASLNTKNDAYTINFELPQGLSFSSSIDNIQVSREINRSFISHLTERLQFTGTPVSVENALFWQSEDGKKTLMIDPQSGYVQYNNSTSPASTATRISQDALLQRAETFIQSLNVVSIQKNTQATTYYLEGLHELTSTTNESEAYFYEFVYTQSYKGTPIYYQYATPATISIMIDRFGNIAGLTFFNIQPTQAQPPTLLDFEKIKERATKGEYALVKVENAEVLPSSGIITITSAAIAYFDNKQSPTLYPIVIFRGNIEGRDVSLYVSVAEN